MGNINVVGFMGIGTPGTSPIPLGRVLASPVDSAGRSGLSFTVLDPVEAIGGERLGIGVLFDVIAAPGFRITDIELELLGTNFLAEDGRVSGSVRKCRHAGPVTSNPPVCEPGALSVFEIAEALQPTASRRFVPVDRLVSEIGFFVDSGLSGTARADALSGIALRFEVNPVTEPPMLALLLSVAVLGIGTHRVRNPGSQAATTGRALGGSESSRAGTASRS